MNFWKKWFSSKAELDDFDKQDPYGALTPDSIVDEIYERHLNELKAIMDDEPQKEVVRDKTDLLQAQSDIQDAVAKMYNLMNPYWGWLPAGMKTQITTVMNDLNDAVKRIVQFYQ